MRRGAVLVLVLVVAGLPLLRAGPALLGARAAPPTPAANKALVRRLFEEVINRGDLAAVAALVAPDYVDHEAGPAAPPGPAGYQGFVAALRATFPDVRVAVEDLVAEGDEVVARVTWRGTQQGALGAIPPTGKAVTFTGIHIYRISGGRIAEHWGLQDDLGLLQQLGAPGPAAWRARGQPG